MSASLCVPPEEMTPEMQLGEWWHAPSMAWRTCNGPICACVRVGRPPANGPDRTLGLLRTHTVMRT